MEAANGWKTTKLQFERTTGESSRSFASTMMGSLEYFSEARIVLSKESTCSSDFERSKNSAWCSSLVSRSRVQSSELVRTKQSPVAIESKPRIMALRMSALSVRTRTDFPDTARVKAFMTALRRTDAPFCRGGGVSSLSCSGSGCVKDFRSSRLVSSLEPLAPSTRRGNAGTEEERATVGSVGETTGGGGGTKAVGGSCASSMSSSVWKKMPPPPPGAGAGAVAARRAGADSEGVSCPGGAVSLYLACAGTISPMGLVVPVSKCRWPDIRLRPSTARAWPCSPTTFSMVATPGPWEPRGFMPNPSRQQSV
mmetsp:Transcript_129831/g.277132  ORF Transcript_129831/g.277132 Transcript_129831/m.277132 type:complete len:310 (+) Transcript_129831:305-1234(+)